MFSFFHNSSSRFAVRFFSSSSVSQNKVAVLGAAGGIGQPLGLLLKNSQQVSELSLFDIVGTPGVAADLSHICSPAKVTGHVGNDQLEAALTGCQVVVIPAGVPRKPGMTRDDLFNTNASIVQSLAEGIAKYCPDAFTCIISNPVNSTVPIAAETFKKAGTYNPQRLFGVTTLDVTRARTFIAETKNVDVNTLDVPVVGGHAGTTILPLLSQNSASLTFTDEERDALTHRIQFGGDEVVKAKDGAGSATLSMAYAGAHFTQRLLAAINGEQNVVECTFVESDVVDGVPFFSSRVQLGPNGAEKIHPLGDLTAFEQDGLKEAVPQLQAQIAKGVDFVKK
mmetsp:Transcript_15327/g.22943  ORF Transcript_15327/g.22943 Transcript_15327/m.22943 type:complete len:338 (+) Transcript_15327:984-1997(+)